MLPAESIDSIDREESTSSLSLIIICVFFFICGLINNEYRIYFQIYGIIGLMFINAKLWLTSEKIGLPVMEEIFLGVATGLFFIDFFFWPIMGLLDGLSMAFNGFEEGLESTSYKNFYHHKKWREIRKEARTANVETVGEITDACTKSLSLQSRHFEEDLSETASTVIKPAMRVAAAGTVTASIALSAHGEALPQIKPSLVSETSIWTDDKGDSQANVLASQDNQVFYMQNRAGYEGKSLTSFPGIGRKFSFPKLGLEGFLVTGLQFNWLNEGKFCAWRNLLVFSFKKAGYVFSSNNVFSHERFFRGRPLSSRHGQALALPWFPKGVSLRTEELHVRRTGFTELYLGPVLPIGRWLFGERSFYGKASLYPYYNFAPKTERWDCRATLVF